MAKFGLPNVDIAGMINPEKLAKFGVNYAANPMTRIKTDAAIAGSFGVAAGMIDRDDDTAASLLGKGVKSVGYDVAAISGGILGAQYYVRSQHFSDTVMKYIDSQGQKKGLPGLGDEKRASASATLNKGMKAVVKPNKGRVMAGGAGLAAGVVYSMLNGNEDGMFGSMGNALAGAGLATVGWEVANHLGKANKESFIERARGSATGTTLEKSVRDILNTDSGQELKSQLGKAMAGDEAKPFRESLEKVVQGDWRSILKEDPSVLKKSAAHVQDSAMEFFTTEKGDTLARDVLKTAREKGPTFAREISASLAQDGQKAIAAHRDLLEKGVGLGQKAYSANQPSIDRFLRNAGLPDQTIQSVGRHIGAAGENFTRKLDDITAERITDRTPTNNPPPPPGEPTKKPGVTSGDVAKIDAELTAEKVQQTDIERRAEKMRGWKRGAGVAGAIGIGAFALASVLDTNQNLEHKKDTSRMTEKQEQNANRKRSKEQKQQSEMAYGHMATGDLLFELYNNSIGHHKMGNAKFQ